MSPPLASLLLLVLAINSTLALRICSFNVRSFGESKKENQNVMDVIVKVSPFFLKGLMDTPHALYSGGI